MPIFITLGRNSNGPDNIGKFFIGYRSITNRKVSIYVPTNPKKSLQLNLEFSSLAIVSLGGGIGTLLRFLILKFFPLTSTSAAQLLISPTMLANTTGSFLLGMIAMKLGSSPEKSALYLFLGVGLCGGLTTFSTLILEIVKITKESSLGLASLYLVTSVTLGTLFFFLGKNLANLKI